MVTAFSAKGLGTPDPRGQSPHEPPPGWSAQAWALGARALEGIGLLAIGVAAAAVGLAFHRVFGYQPLLTPSCVAAGIPVLLTAVQGLTRKIPFAASLALSASAWLLTACLTLAPVPHGGPLSSRALATVVGGAVNDWAQLLNTTMPVSARPGLLVLPFTLTWLSASIGTELVLRTRAALAPIAPALLALTIATSLSVPIGESNLPEAGAVTLAASVLVTLRNFQAVRPSRVIANRAWKQPWQQDRERGTSPAGVRLPGPRAALAAAALIAAVTAAAVTVSPFSLFHRNAVNPRRYWQISLRPVPLINPLDQVAGWLARPGQLLFQVRSPDVADLQLAVLDTFNGQRWTSSSRFTPIGLTLPPPPSTRPLRMITARVQLGRLGGRLLPAVSWPVTIRGLQGISADAATGMLLSSRPLRPGMSYSLVSDLGPGIQPRQLVGLAAANGPGTSRDLQLPSSLPSAIYRVAHKATATGAAATAFERAALLERYLRDTFTNDPRTPAGYTDGDLERFLATRVGTCVQFASVFTLAARMLGIPSRIVAGFAPGTASLGSYIHQIRAGDALVWSEADFTGIGWVPFFPTPPPASHRPSPLEPALGETAAQARIRAKALRLTPEQFAPAASPARRGVNGGGRASAPMPGRSRWLAWIWYAAGAGVLCYLIVALLAGPVRRHRRRTRGTAQDRIVGAWHDLLEQLADMKMSLPPGAANSVIATAAAQAAGKAAVPELSSLAVLVTRALFAAAEPADQQAVRAWRYRDISRNLLRQATPLHRRLQARLIVLPRKSGPARPPGTTRELVIRTGPDATQR